MKKITIGILAHVDAGKTTCVEAMLYKSGNLKKLGRVDHKDAFLDYDEEERNHGITIYAKEAYFTWKDLEIYVIDTPGHVDFSSEMERSLQVLDLAIILINGQDGVQSHTETIWKCLEHYHVPCIVFINKMDISHYTKEELMNDLIQHCSEKCVDYFSNDKYEKIAMTNDTLLEEYTSTDTIQLEHIQEAVMNRNLFPCLFGSALKVDGIEELLDTIQEVYIPKAYGDEFGARVYKISEDKAGNRLTHLKVTGGKLVVKSKIEDEKIDQIRIYNGTSFITKEEVDAGSICVLKGITQLETGQGLGFEEDIAKPLLDPVMEYELIYNRDVNILELSEVCKKLAQEDPQLHIVTDAISKKIHVQIMGEMQMEILQKKIFQLSGINVSFKEGTIVYKETIGNTVIGRGHFEPLRHYAEVHVCLEPLEKGKGIIIANECPRDMISLNFQRSILTTLSSLKYRGVLTGSYLTDTKITLIAARGSLKHTESGDFREAIIRAVRQGLKKADSILLEPFYYFSLVIPQESLSKALYDLEMRKCTVKVLDTSDGDKVTITGKGPVRYLSNYQNEVIAYTKGKGRYFKESTEYEPCVEQDKIVEEIGYDSERDLRNPTGSVFCAHGAGYFVPWNEADGLMHIELKDSSTNSSYAREKIKVEEKDLKKILESATGNNRNTNKQPPVKKKEEKEKPHKLEPIKPSCLLVDGYNMIYDWQDLAEVAKEDLSTAREMLIDRIYNYQAYARCRVILVFDGYKVKDNPGSSMKKGNNMEVVYTRSGQSADSYIEKASSDLKKDYAITVATSDGLIQNAALAHGALRISARELESRIHMSNIATKG